jgi:hypothetical protein
VQKPVNNYVKQIFTGENILQLGNILANPSGSINAQTYSLNFDGSGDYVELPNNKAFLPTGGEFTVEAWVKIDASFTGSGELKS